MDSPPCVSGPGVLQRSEVHGTISSARNPSDGSMACHFGERVDNDLLRPILDRYGTPILGRYGYPFLSDMAHPFYPIGMLKLSAQTLDFVSLRVALVVAVFLWLRTFSCLALRRPCGFQELCLGQLRTSLHKIMTTSTQRR